MPISKGDRVISSLADWELHAPPKSAHHWVDGRSAKEVARAWLEGNGKTMPSEVHAVLAAHPCFGPILSWDAEPEARMPFDLFPGEPRNSDLAVHVRDAAGSYVLAIEAKADEPYGETVAEAFASALERHIENPRSNGVARIERLAAFLLQPRTEGALRAHELRYQLLTACAGAIAEASRKKCARAVMLVHEIVSSVTTETNHARNSSDLEAFLTRLSGATSGAVADGRLYGPYCFEKEGVQLFIGKVARNCRSKNS